MQCRGQKKTEDKEYETARSTNAMAKAPSKDKTLARADLVLLFSDEDGLSDADIPLGQEPNCQATDFQNIFNTSRFTTP